MEKRKLSEGGFFFEMTDECTICHETLKGNVFATTDDPADSSAKTCLQCMEIWCATAVIPVSMIGRNPIASYSVYAENGQHLQTIPVREKNNDERLPEHGAIIIVVQSQQEPPQQEPPQQEVPPRPERAERAERAENLRMAKRLATGVMVILLILFLALFAYVYKFFGMQLLAHISLGLALATPIIWILVYGYIDCQQTYV